MVSASHRFKVLGPFDVPIKRENGERKIDCRPARKAVFEQADVHLNGKFDIKLAIGLYVFCLSPSGSSRIYPYYVGQACRQTLWVRSFQLSDKPRVYSEIVNDYARAKPVMFLLPLLTPSAKAARRGSNQKRINFAEQQLIGMALQANESLWNSKHRAALESFSIDGVHKQTGKNSESTSKFRSMLNFEN